MDQDARSVAHAYFHHWTEHRFAEASALLDPSLEVEVPLHEYPTRASFEQALAGFGAMVERVEMLSELGGDGEAMQLYDMQVTGLGTIRIAEHFTVRDGRILRLRQIHDTTLLRAAGFGA